MRSFFQFLRNLRGAPPAARRPCRRPVPVRLAFEGLEERALLSANPFSLGAAGRFGILGINGGQVTVKDSHVVGDIGYSPGEFGTLQHADETGTVRIDPTARVDLSGVGKGFSATAQVVSENLGQAALDANAASAAYAGLAPTQNLGDLTASVTVTGRGGLNVIALNSLSFTNQVLTLRGGPQD